MHTHDFDLRGNGGLKVLLQHLLSKIRGRHAPGGIEKLTPSISIHCELLIPLGLRLNG
jgi:hypothetical protein